MTVFSGKQVLVIGMGLSGRSAAKFLLSLGARVLGVDKNQELLDNNVEIAELRSLGGLLVHESYSLPWDKIQMVVVSPGISKQHFLIKNAEKSGLEILGEVELACRFINQKCIGITGTNGKTTVTLLVEHVLNHCGIPAKALGNVEVPLAAALMEKGISSKVLVLELSSFQLESLQTPILDAAVVLNITPDHLDRYKSMQEYAKAKFLIARCLKPKGQLFVEDRAFTEFGTFLKGKSMSLYGYRPDCDFFITKDEVMIKNEDSYPIPEIWKGKISHEIENQTAAFALCREMGVTARQFSEALQSFKKPSHRLEFVANCRGIAFYDDSKGTNIDAVIRAVGSLPKKIVLIAGGVDKGASYIPWIQAFDGKVKGICAIGQAAEKMKHELSLAMPVKICPTLGDAVKDAAAWADKGDIVLLSPGCSSYDMFRDYKHRGEEYKKFVLQLGAT